MTKLIHGLVATCLSTKPARALDLPFVWVGQMVLQGPRLQRRGQRHGRHRLPPQAAGGGGQLDPVLLSFGLASGTARRIAPTLQFDGVGTYAGSFVTGCASTSTNRGTFDLAVRPATVTPATDFVTFSGTFTNSVGLDGCNLEVRGAASRLPR